MQMGESNEYGVAYSSLKQLSSKEELYPFAGAN